MPELTPIISNLNELTIDSNSFRLFGACLKEASSGNYSPKIKTDEHSATLAPNGSISKLPNDLFVKITRTPTFKEWFGDWVNHTESASKVVYKDTNEPRIMYHCSSEDIPIETGLDEDHTRYGAIRPQAVWFKTNPDYSYGDYVYPVFLNIKIPVDKNNYIVDGYIPTGGPEYYCVLSKKNLMHIPNAV